MPKYLLDNEGYAILEEIYFLDEIYLDEIHFLDLPIEIFFEFFEWLDTSDIIRFGNTCQTICNYASNYLKLEIIPLRSPYYLYDYQLIGIKWMEYRENTIHNGILGGILGLQMGLGKTLISLAYCFQKPRQAVLLI